MSRRDGPLALCLFALLASIYLLSFSGRYHSADEMSMLVATDSVARRGAWDTDLLRWMGEQQGSLGADGHLYSRKGIGMTLAALPLYWLALQSQLLGNVHAAMLTGGLLTALTGLLVYATARRLRYDQGPSLGTALAYGLATMAWPYARYLFSETLAGLGLMLAVYAVVSYGMSCSYPQPSEATGAGRHSCPQSAAHAALGKWWYPLLAGAGLGIALLARLNNAIAGPFLALGLLAYCCRQSQGSRWACLRPLALFALPVLMALALSGWYNWLRFGSPLTTGYLAEESWSSPFLASFYGLTLSPGKGLFWYNPILFAGLFTWPTFFRRHRIEAMLVGGIVLANVAFYAPWYLWWAGHSWGPRFLVTILPVAILPLAPAIRAAARSRPLALGLAALILISVTIQLLGVAVSFNAYLEDIYARLGLYHPATLFNPSYSPLVRQWSYLRFANLDLAWAQGGSLNWVALLVGLFLVLLSGLALRAAWRGRLRAWMGLGLLVLLAAGAIGTLALYAPTGDMAKATRALATMERPGEAAALTDSLLGETFQNAYDGHLPVWGVSTKDGVGGDAEAVWTVGAGTSGTAAARFQVGSLRLDLYLPPGQQFETGRLPLRPDAERMRLGDIAEMVGVEWRGSKVTAARAGDVIPLTLYWRALAPTATSYTVFVQVIDGADVKAGQVDRLPCSGDCPTSTWLPGDVVGDWYEIPIRSDAPPGTYQVIVGMYDLATGERLPVSDNQGRSTGSYLSAGYLEVLPSAKASVSVTGTARPTPSTSIR